MGQGKKTQNEHSTDRADFGAKKPKILQLGF